MNIIKNISNEFKLDMFFLDKKREFISYFLNTNNLLKT